MCAVLKITNPNQFKAQIRRWTRQVQGGAEIAARGMARAALENAVMHSPQYSGQFAASWNLSVGSPNFSSYQPQMQVVNGVDVPFHEGHDQAVREALTRNFGALGGFRLGQTIYLANDVEHDEPYSILIEQNRIRFRDENPSGGETLARALEFVQRRYASIGKAQLAELIGV